MKPIHVEVHYNAAKETVWKALTEHKQMVEWYFKEIEDFQPVPGFITEFSVQAETREFVHRWEVTEVIPGKSISYEWLYPAFEGNSRVQFELEEDGKQTRLHLLCWGIETYPQEIPEFSAESCRAGWMWFLDKRLREYLETASNG